MGAYGASLAYNVSPRVEFGAGAGWSEARGRASSTLNGALGSNVTYDLYPVELFVLARGMVNEDQWLIPYIGGGLTRMYYRQQVQGQKAVQGSANGHHIRAGLQLSLNALDQSASSGMYRDYGIYHTYLILEVESTKAVKQSIDLGGTSLMGGLLFEF